MRRADKLAEGEFGLHLEQMMENAGRALARLALQELKRAGDSDRGVIVLAGPGGNGGGGLTAARRLRAWGVSVYVSLSHPVDELEATTRHQLQTAVAMGVEVLDSLPGRTPALVLDAYLGYSIRGEPRPPMDAGIRWANQSRAPILALDVPTGLNPDSGEAAENTIRAQATVTLALPKTGLLTASARPYVGELWLADIGLPPELFAAVGLSVPTDLFHPDDLVRWAK